MKDIYGDVFWFKEAGAFAVDGPGVFYRLENGTSVVLHREGAPAVERADGTVEWWVNGQLHRDGGPAVIRSDDTVFWYRRHLCHRDDGPAVERPDGSKEWISNDKPHRDDGPCTIDHLGKAFAWAVHGKPMSEAEHAEHRASLSPQSVALRTCQTLSVGKLKFAAKAGA